MSDDVVAELDRWLEVEMGLHHVPPDGAGLIAVAKVQRARDEIMALREKVFIFAASNEETKINIRAEALEEAAQICIGLVRQFPQCGVAASAIRALKDKRHG